MRRISAEDEKRQAVRNDRFSVHISFTNFCRYNGEKRLQSGYRQLCKLHIKRTKLLKMFYLTFGLQYGIIYIEGNNKTSPSEMECRTMKRRLNKKHLAEFITGVMMWAFFIWIIASVIDVDIHNTVPNPHYAVWNIFNLFF